jgi:RNA polymerase sigma factor (sigma-70 family)
VKRNPALHDLDAKAEIDSSPRMDVDIVALDEALENLLKFEPRLAQVVELHYFGGMTYDEIAATVGASTATVHRDIRLARAWLLDEIDGQRAR